MKDGFGLVLKMKQKLNHLQGLGPFSVVSYALSDLRIKTSK